MAEHRIGESTTHSKNVSRRTEGYYPSCGSTSHSRSSHRLCPANARNRETQLSTDCPSCGSTANARNLETQISTVVVFVLLISYHEKVPVKQDWLLDSEDIAIIIDKIYPDLRQYHDPSFYATRTILTTKNAFVGRINIEATESFPGEAKTTNQWTPSSTATIPSTTLSTILWNSFNHCIRMICPAIFSPSKSGCH
ncbi:hypothetical protein BC941DRAFT_472758 [Chlamydoabsidia padenii]|nr:hypothetical protein BC941DRAFT_472758 [Chlamydoabsidia padenii]